MEDDQFIYATLGISLLLTALITKFTPVLTFIIPGAEFAFVIMLFIICFLSVLIILACAVK